MLARLQVDGLQGDTSYHFRVWPEWLGDGENRAFGLRNVVGRSLRPSDVLLDSGTWVLRWPAQVGVPHEPQARVSTAADC